MRKLDQLSIIFAVLALSSCAAIKTSPLTLAQKQENALQSLREIYSSQERLDKPLTLYEAMARGIKYNLDTRVKYLEGAVASGDFSNAAFALMPKAEANLMISSRNNEPGSKSISLSSGQESLEFSKSSDKNERTAELSASWNLLELGIGFVRARQQADAILVAEERRRAVAQSVVRDVRDAYYRAVISQRYIIRAGELLAQASAALKRSKDALKKNLVSEDVALTYQKNLLTDMTRLHSLIKDLAPAKAELAALINVPPSVDFELQTSDQDLYILPQMDYKIEDLERYALIYRPELIEGDLQYRIEKREATKAWLGLLPSIIPNATERYDSNQFLYNNSFATVGVKMAYDVLYPLSLPSKISRSNAAAEVVKARRNALTVAVLTQVNVSYIQHYRALEGAGLYDDMANVSRSIYEQKLKRFKSEDLAEQDLIGYAVNALYAELDRDVNYSKLQKTYAQLISSVGIDVVPSYVVTDDVDVEYLAKQLEKHTRSLMKIKRSDSILDMKPVSEVYAKSVVRKKAKSVPKPEAKPQDKKPKNEQVNVKKN